MGYDLMENFRRPYFARSVREFWQRWHISLSTWFRDYLYIPMGGNRVVKWRWYYNLLIVFLLSGLWHGANWTFVTWGLLHAAYMILGVASKPWRERVWARVPVKFRDLGAWFLTLHLVVLAWIFFRAPTISTAATMLARVFTDFRLGSWSRFGDPYALAVALAVSLFLVLTHLVGRGYAFDEGMHRQNQWVRWSFYAALVVGILLFGNFGEAEFIYFQF